jgi:hypothetical protein
MKTPNTGVAKSLLAISIVALAADVSAKTNTSLLQVSAVPPSLAAADDRDVTDIELMTDESMVAEQQASNDAVNDAMSVADAALEAEANDIEMPSASIEDEVADGAILSQSASDESTSLELGLPMNQAPVTLTSMSMSLNDFVALVAENNDRINFQRMEWEISRAGVDSARSMYEPALIASYRYTDSNTLNTTEEEFRRAFAPEFIEENHCCPVKN